MKNIVIMVTDIDKCGGVQRVVTMISNQLCNNEKYNIVILSVFKSGINPFFSLNRDIRVDYLFNEKFDIRTKFFKVIHGLRNYLKNNRTDILISAGIGYSSIIKIATWKHKNLKIIGWEHQNFFFGKKFGLEWVGKRVACKYFDAIVVLTKEDLKNYKKNIRHIKNIKQIYNPIENIDFNSIYEFKSKKIISCGGLVPQKGFDFAVDVAKEVFKEYPDWKWEIYGDGYLKESLCKKIKEYGLNHNLILKGYNSDILSKYKEYSMYVMTSRHEGFPMVLLEAQSNKLPIICFDCLCGPSEIVENNHNGYIIECFDTKKMATKIKELIQDTQKRIEFSNNTITNLEYLSIDVIIDEWECLLDNL